jgi:glucose/arabinose dehydrogenase
MFNYRWIGSILIALMLLGFSTSVKTAAKTELNSPASIASISLTLVKDGFSRPVHITHAGDGSGRLFVVEQAGRIYILLNGNKISTPFLDIHERVLAPPGGEEGLLSVAFPPGFGPANNHFYVYYTNTSGGNQVSRFRLSSNPDIADPDSEKLILLIPHPTFTNHNGGQLAFGPDGYLYIGTGDGGGGGDPSGNAQNPASLLGKLLRIDVEPGTPSLSDLPNKIYLPSVSLSGGNAYTIPLDNPFVGRSGYRPEIWALGLRNPWRFTFDRLTGDLYIGDVGQGDREEIDFQPVPDQGGENYGWNIMEGFACYPLGSSCSSTGLTLPIHDYPHTEGCSVTGGFVYRGGSLVALQGIYLYGDFCTGKIWGLQRISGTWQNQLLNNGDQTLISSFGEDQTGELYLTTLSGAVYHIVTP